MIRVKKIAHAIYEMPDVDKQTEYYTEILGLTVTGKDKDAVYLASTVDHHSVVLRKGSQSQVRARRLPDRARRRSQRVREAGAGSRHQDRAQEGPGALDLRHGHVRGPEGHGHGGVQARRILGPALPDQGHRPAQARPRRVLRHRRQEHDQVLCATCSAFASPTGWAISSRSCAAARPPHHQPDADQIEDRHFHTAFELRDWAHLQTACDYLSLNGYKLLWGPGRHGIGHNLFAYHRAPNGLITELFAELDQMNEELGYFEPRPWHRDNPQRPKVWAKDPSASNLWGIMPPDEMHH